MKTYVELIPSRNYTQVRILNAGTRQRSTYDSTAVLPAKETAVNRKQYVRCSPHPRQRRYGCGSNERNSVSAWN